MGDHFVLLVDRLLTEATLEAAIRSRDDQLIVDANAHETMMNKETEFFPTERKAGNDLGTGKIVECRICQDEDVDYKMEIPCSCCGSLKYAHRKCIQKWCNEKGDTICEICLQPFQPGYTAPPKLFMYGSIPMNFRGNWEIQRRNIDNHHYITMSQTDRRVMEPYDDDYAADVARSITHCRILAAILMVLLFLRHSIPFIMNEVEYFSFSQFTLQLLRVGGIILPLYAMLRAITTFYHRRQRQQEMYESSISV